MCPVHSIWRKKRCHQFSPTKLCKTLLIHRARSYVHSTRYTKKSSTNALCQKMLVKLSPALISPTPHRAKKLIRNHLEAGVNLTKLFFFGKGEFFCFLLISLTISHKYIFFPFLQTLKLNGKNRKTGKMKVWQE